MNALLALAASALWGTSDFGGGLISRRLDASAAVLISQAMAFAGLLVLFPFLHVPAGPYLLIAAAAGVVATLSLAAFYRAMATAPMSLVAPITAAGSAIPVLVGIVRGEHLSILQLAGIVVTLTGIVLASGPEFRSGVAVRRQALILAIGAAVGFGVAYTLLPLAAGTNLYGTLLCQRIGGLIVLGPIVLRTGVLRGIRLIAQAAGRPRRDRRRRHRRQRFVRAGRQPRQPVDRRRARVALPGRDGAAGQGDPVRAVAARAERRRRGALWLVCFC